MDFFLEIHNRECGLVGHFCDHQRDHGPENVSTQAEPRTRNQNKNKNPGGGIKQGESTLLNIN